MKKISIALLLLLSVTLCNAQSWLWGQQAISPWTSEAWSVAVDKWNNAYLTGGYSQKIHYGSIYLKSTSTAFTLVKYNSSGNVICIPIQLMHLFRRLIYWGSQQVFIYIVSFQNQVSQYPQENLLSNKYR